MSISSVNGVASTVSRYRFVAAGGETSLSGTDANGATLSYLIGKEEVYLNGALLVRGQDYTGTDGATISSLTALVAGDTVEIITFVPFAIPTAISSSTVTTKGDLIVATGAGSVTRLGAGTDNYLLSASSSSSTGLTWTTNPLAVITTAGDLLVGTGAGAVTRLGVGSSGQYLKYNGSSLGWAPAGLPSEIYSLTTSRIWLNSSYTTAGNYSYVTTAGNAYLYFYDSSNNLISEYTATTTSQTQTINTAISRIEAQGNTSLNLTISQAPSIVATTGGVTAVDIITGSGTYGVGTGTATGGTSGYVAGQLAHVLVVGAGGQGGAGYSQCGYPLTGGIGQGGGVAATTSPITLSGTYTLSLGQGGSGANGSSAGNPGTGNTTGFGLTATPGGGGNRRLDGTGGGSPGTPSFSSGSTITNIFGPTSYSQLGGGAGGSGGGDYGVSGSAGQKGSIVILRWTPH
jgi:hypothetical protein